MDCLAGVVQIANLRGHRLESQHSCTTAAGMDSFAIVKEGRVAYPTQKALDVVRWSLDEFSKPGDLILDPFLGSGTTAVATKMLGRNYLGIELNPEYVKIAKKRLMEAVGTELTAGKTRITHAEQ